MMPTRLRVLLVLAVVLSAPRRSVSAQEASGSFGVTFAAATAGAALGLGTASLFYHGGSSGCPTVPGARCGGDGSAVLLTIGGMLVGATAGAVLGRQLMRGHQSIPRSLGGAALGMLVGGSL